MPSTFDRILRGLRRLTAATRPEDRARRRSRRHPSAPPTPPSKREASPAAYGPVYPGDATTLPDMTYRPEPDGAPDPGEIVWTWVPYEEDHSQGKDRPVLVIGHDGDWLVALQLTSRDHDRDEAQERRAGRAWVDIGTGAWDPRGRPSEVRTNRLIRVAPDGIRREGAVLARHRYEEVIAAVRAAHRG